MTRDVVFSGVQPSGTLHLGNYLGALCNWAELQDKYNCLFCVVDLHAITANKYSPSKLKDNILKTVATYIACGIDSEKSAIFNQSAVPHHAELCWLLSCYTPLGWLNRMTQFKSKAGNDKSKASLGLYNYPVLMAADILLYKAKYIPVGDDQKQHIELTRDIANAFNSHYQISYFTPPEALILQDSARIMSLKDGLKKMSKSDASDYSRINLDDNSDAITEKIKKAKTDSTIGFEFSLLQDRPEVYNLVNIYSILSNINVEKTCKKIINYNMESFKKELADLVITQLSPIRDKINDLLQDKSYLYSIMKSGAERAQEISSKNIKDIKEIIGFPQI
ncbi:MAG: tryptophan--tRNA ligase [Candidatus Mesenet longicola]|uniref:Tryptophan--tRNA ligase n=1 Tax=Candidatus Mesenet longicola TaxID=1892558 RepID=A0A8J3HVQ4_9RICK|nr:MAG: tryptophan--tRNA ligase [Candidatus Mesenet longicola]GHM59800.1 MAG: tryptophan--tRNA ligase [Candidatus Mesenet longicola]